MLVAADDGVAADADADGDGVATDADGDGSRVAADAGRGGNDGAEAMGLQTFVLTLADNFPAQLVLLLLTTIDRQFFNAFAQDQ